MLIVVSTFDEPGHFESLRDTLVACGVDVSSLQVVGSHSDAPLEPNLSGVLAVLRVLYEGTPHSEGQLLIYAEKVLRGGATMRLEVSDAQQAKLVHKLVRASYLSRG